MRASIGNPTRTPRSRKMKIQTILAVWCCWFKCLCTGFVPKATTQFTDCRHKSTAKITTPRNVVGSEIAAEIDESRTAFFLWFFGASGAAGIARSAFPRQYNAVMKIRSLKGVGPSLGGETIKLNPLCGYPDDLCIRDLEKIVNNRLSIEQIVQRFPIEGNFLSRKGYLTFDAFEMANEGSNPLAIRAIFDTFAQSTDSCDPKVAQAKMDSYKDDISAIGKGLVNSKLQGFSAIATLLFLLGLADIVAAGHLYHGWFPEWPGGNNFPWCLFDPETGPWHIPEYWI